MQEEMRSRMWAGEAQLSSQLLSSTLSTAPPPVKWQWQYTPARAQTLQLTTEGFRFPAS